MENENQQTHKKLQELKLILAKNPFGSSLSQIMNDCRISVKTAKNLLAIAEFVKKDGDLYFLSEHKQAQAKIMDSIKNKKPSSTVKPKEEKLVTEVKLPSSNNKTYSQLSYAEINRLLNDKERRKALLCSSSDTDLTLAKMAYSYPVPLQTKDLYFANKLKEAIKDYLELSETIVDCEQTLMVNRRNALKRALQLSIIMHLDNTGVDVQEVLLNEKLDNLYSDLVNRVVSDWDFSNKMNVNFAFLKFFKEVSRNLSYYAIYHKCKKENKEQTLESILELDNIDEKTVMAFCSGWQLSPTTLIGKTAKGINRLIDDAQSIIECPLIPDSNRSFAVMHYLNFIAYQLGISYDAKSDNSKKAYHAVQAKVSEILFLFEHYNNKAGSLKNNPFQSEIYKPFIKAINDFGNFVNDIIAMYKLDDSSPKKQDITIETEQTKEKESMSEVVEEVKQKTSIPQKYADSIKVKQVKEMYLSLDDALELLRTTFDMDEVKLKRNGGAVIGFELTAERKIQ